MSDLSINATVRVDAAQGTAALASTEAASSQVAAAMRATGAAAAAAATDLADNQTATRGTATAAAEAASATRAVTTALAAEKDAAAAATAANDELTASERAATVAAAAQSTAHRAVGSSAGTARLQLLELGHIGRSLGDELAAGVPPMQALTLEAGRLVEVISLSGGIVPAVKSAVAALGGPWVVGFGVAVVAALGLVEVLTSASRHTADLEAAEKLLSSRQSELKTYFDATTGAINQQITATQRLAEAKKLGDAVDFGRDANDAKRALLQAGRSSYQPTAGSERGIPINVPFTDSPSREAIKSLTEQLAAGSITADKFGQAVEKIAAGDGSVRQLADQLVGLAAASIQADQNLARSQAQVAVLNGTATATQRALLGIVDPGKSVADIVARVSAGTDKAAAAQARYNVALEKLKAAYNDGKGTITEPQFEAGVAAAAKDRDTDVAAATADKKAATAAAEAEKAREKKLADLAETIRLIEGEADAAAHVKEVRSEEIKILELRKQYGNLFTAAQEDQVRLALQTKALYEGLNKTLVENAKALDTGPVSVTDIVAKQDAARKKEGSTPGTLGNAVDDIAQTLDDQFWAARGKKFGETAGQSFQSTAAEVGSVIGGIAGAKIGALATKALQSAGKSTDGLSGSLQVFQDSFKNYNKATVDKLGDLFSNVFGGDGSKFAKVAGTAFAGAAQGQAAGSLLSSFGVKTSSAGSEIGGALGSFLSPLGGIIGGAVGGILGGLFGGRPATSNSDVLSSAITEGNASGSNNIQTTAAKGLGDQVQNGLAQIASALGGTLQDFAPITIGQRNDNYRVDTTGATIGKYNGTDFGTGDAAAAAAVSYAVEVALQRGAVGGLSAHVQAVIAQYGDDLNKAITEALKVKDLESTLADAANPYATAFQDFENQAAQRLQVAKQYGFDVLQVEKVNADQRAKLIEDTLSSATQSVKSVIDDLQFGSLATGSVAQQRAALQAEEARLTDLVNGGDTSQLSNLSSIVQQLVELDKQAYGSTDAYSASRDQALSLLNGLVQQTSDKITAASVAAQGGTAADASAAAATDPTVAGLTELNATGDDQVNLLTQANATLAQIASTISLNTGSGGGSGGGSGVLTQTYARTAVV